MRIFETIKNGLILSFFFWLAMAVIYHLAWNVF